MRIRKQVYRIVHTDVKVLKVEEVETALRKGKKTNCAFCGNKITDKTFIVAFTDKGSNPFFHRCCYPNAHFDDKIWKDGDPDCAKCGHPYHRHYDLYESNSLDQEDFFAGCKYCTCRTWKPKDDWKYPDGD